MSAPNFADEPQVLYRMFDADGSLLYVGITVHVGGRFDHHRRNKPWWTDVARIELQHFPDRGSVEDAERDAVVSERPRYNIALVPVPPRPAKTAAPPVRRTPQRTVGVDDELWEDCLLIAEAKRQNLTDVMRAALVEFREENRALLDRERARGVDG